MSGSISYTRQWSHKDWIDFVDSVQASGPNGINGRLHRIEGEFDRISGVIDLIATALQTPLVTQQTMTIAPALINLSASVWVQQQGFVATQAASATGYMAINLPNGATIQGLRVTGASSGGILTVALYRQPLVGGHEAIVVQVFNNFAPSATQTAFDLPLSPQNVNVVVDNTTQKYFLVASLANGNTAAGSGGTSLNAFQITYNSS
jgi:hypothetical protein